jgi:hypothetical protein
MVQLYRIVHTSFMEEMEILAKHERGVYKTSQEKIRKLNENITEIWRQLYLIQQEQQKNINIDHEIFQKQQEMTVEHNSGKRANPFSSDEEILRKKKKIELDAAEYESAAKKKDLEKNKAILVQNFWIVFDFYAEIQNDVLVNHLENWKTEQRKNGYGNRTELTSIQKICEDLADSIISLKQIFEQISEKSLKDDQSTKIDTTFQDLVEKTFIVLKQPPQVIIL